jgi:hypothetical protein
MATIGAGVLGLLCLSSSAYAAMNMGGGEETPAQITVVPDIETKVEAEAEAKPEAGIDTFGTETVKGQYVRLWQGEPYQSQDAYALNILELEVYDSSGTNIAQGKSATSSSQYPGDHQPVLAFDGSLDTKYRSNYDVEEDWLEVDLGSVMEIHKIVIKHTGSEDVYEGVAMKDGLRGYIEIFDGNGTIGKTTQIGVTSTDDVYTYNFKERGGGKWRGGQGLLKSRADIIAKKQAADAAADEEEQKRIATAKKAEAAKKVEAAKKAEADQKIADAADELAKVQAATAAETARLAYLSTISGRAGAGAFANIGECWAEAKNMPDWGSNSKSSCCDMDYESGSWATWDQNSASFWCSDNTG